MSLPVISFVIIEYHSIDDVSKCIASLISNSTHFPYEVIVSSNSCYSNEDQERLLDRFDGIQWSFNPRNGGFAYAMNQGLKLARGKYLVILNPDVRIKYGLDQMLQFMDEHPQVGAIAPQIVNPQGMIQDSARPYVTLQRYAWRCVKRMATKTSSVLDNKMDYKQIQTVDWVIGAFIMISREAYEKTNGLDESYFMYAEDLDWCTRIRKAGKEIVYYPLAQIEYEGSRSARRSLKYAKIFFKSHFYYWYKHGFFFGHPKRKPL